MTTNTPGWPGRIALMTAHCAGMIDLVALPVWMGALIGYYHFQPQQAGGLVTLFLGGAVLSSLFFASRFNRLSPRRSTVIGFALAGGAFGVAATTDRYEILATLHFIAGAAVACALSFTHGTIARSINPHRLFATVSLALGIFAIAFLGMTPTLVATRGGPALFLVFAAIMVAATLTAALAFPTLPQAPRVAQAGRPHPIPPAIWFGVIGVSCLGLTQAMIFSFVERIGIERGFGVDAVSGVLIALGFVNLVPAPLAALLEKRISARAVMVVGPACQALLALAIAFGSGFWAYALPTAMFAAVMIFIHTFAFGALSRLDPSSRIVAGTPAMLMTGAALGPVIGGTLVQTFGYPSLGIAALAVDLAAVLLFFFLPAAAETEDAPAPLAA